MPGGGNISSIWSHRARAAPADLAIIGRNWRSFAYAPVCRGTLVAPVVIANLMTSRWTLLSLGAAAALTGWLGAVHDGVADT